MLHVPAYIHDVVTQAHNPALPCIALQKLALIVPARPVRFQSDFLPYIRAAQLSGSPCRPTPEVESLEPPQLAR